MPALKVYGRFWHLSGDDIPLFAMFGAVFHLAWVVLIFISGNAIINMPQQCHHQGKQYIATVFGLLLAFLFGFILEVLLIIEGCKGTIFEPSKRRRMPFILSLRFINLIIELVFTSYGSYVVWGTKLRCRISETVVFSPKKEIMILIILTWVFEVLTVLNAALWYNMWPDVEVPERWENRFTWIGRYLCCHFRPYSGDKEDKASEEYHNSLRRIARWVNKVVGKLDLTPSDSALALVLVATLQRRARREKIKTALQAARMSEQGLTAISLMERANTVRTLPELNASSGYMKMPGYMSQASMEEDGVVRISPPDGGSPIFVKAELTAGLMTQGVPLEQAVAQSSAATRAQSKALSEHDLEEPLLPAEDRQEEDSGDAQTAPGSIGSKNPLENFQRQMGLLQMACLTPSSMDEELRGAIPQEEAVQLYTGGHWKVPAGLLSEVEHFARFAVGVYGFDLEVLKQRGWWKTLKKALKWTRKKTNQDAINKSKMKTLYQQLFYEGVKEEMGQSSELLYVSVENQLLSHLPYIIALDHTSRSVIVSVRGTWSMEDIITDSVADPLLLTDWLPQGFRDEHGDETKQMWAHSGIIGAADAILVDLEANGILEALLQGEEDVSEAAPKNQAAERVASTGKRSTPGEARKAAGHFVAAIMNRKLDCKGWQLVVTGHSLGAGAAALIALKLYGRFPGVKCWSFSPPGGLMSKNLSRAVQPFVTSVVCGKDVVPRLSIVNVGRLIDQMVTSLALCKHNKNWMLLGHMSAYWRHERVNELFWDYDQVPKEALKLLQEYSADVESRNRMVELVPPGHVILLRPFKVHGERHSWDAVWVKAEEIIREGILVSPTMANDHYALTLQAALASAQGEDEEMGYRRSYAPTSYAASEGGGSSAANY